MDMRPFRGARVRPGIGAMITKARAKNILLEIANAIVDVVRTTGPAGTPASVLYAALMPHGCTLQQFEALMGGLVDAGKLNERGGCYFVP